MSRIAYRLLPIALGLGAFLTLGSGDSIGAEPRGYLSWRAPYGSPRASDTLLVPCGEEGRKDTLYVTFQSGQKGTAFSGMSAALLFRAPALDTLGTHWWFDVNGENLEVQYSPDSIPGLTRPSVTPVNMISNQYDRTKGSGSLRLNCVRPIWLSVPVRDSVQYFFARILVPRPPANYLRCDQSICIELQAGAVLLDTTYTSVPLSTKAGHRFVSWNSPGGVCRDFTNDLEPTPKAAEPAKKKKGRTR